jgi:ribosomal protein S13
VSAAIKARLKDSTGRRGEEIATVLKEAEDNEVIGRLRVSALLESLPGVGKVKAQQIMEEIGISPSRKIRGLGAHQAEKLVAHFSE